MASKYLDIGTQTRLSSEVRSAVDGMRNSIFGLNTVCSKMDSFESDWISLAAQLGLAKPEQAQEVYELFQKVKSIMVDTDLQSLLGRM